MAPQETAAKAEKEESEVKKEEGADEVKKEEPDAEEAKKEEPEAAKEEAADAEMKEAPKEEEMEEEPEPQGPQEKEEDAPADSRPKIKAEQVFLNMAEATPNVMPSADGRLLMTLCDGGFQYMLAGVRSSVGMKAGRYMFEAKIIETLNPYEGRAQDQQGQRRSTTPGPRQLVRVGFSLSSPTALLEDGADKFYFDCDGNFVHQRQRSRAAHRFQKDNVVAVVLNLDEKSPNANTVSLFIDGYRASDPQPLPEGLVGKVLYPTVTYKNVTLQVNFGPTPMRALPFTCRMFQDAAVKDVELTPAPKGGLPEVVFPVGLPDQGVFDWLDQFLEKNPKYFELSDRKVLEWAHKSGLYRPKGYNWRISNDKPTMNFGISMMDDCSVQTALAAVAPALRRDFVMMELSANLLAAERKKALSRFPSSDFKRVAVVMMGEPPAEYKEAVQKLMLDEKIARAEREKQKKGDEEKRKEALDKRQKDAEQARRAREAPPDEEGEEEQKEDKEEKEGEEGEKEGGEGEKEAKEGEAEEKKDAEMKPAEETPSAEEKKEAEEDKPVVLTEEEKAIWYRKTLSPDLAPAALAKHFAKFSIPAKEEGFDEIRYVWQKPEKSAEVMKGWMLDLKKTQRCEDLEPSEWFKEKWAAWQKVYGEWKKKQSEAKETMRKKVAAPEKKAAEKKPEPEKKDEEDKKDAGEGDEAKKAGDEKEAKEDEEGKEEKKDETDPMEIDEDEIDVFTLEDIYDIGNGRPVFANFVYEDWTLLNLRYELHLLVHAFVRDVDDPDRPGFHQSHLAFYYNKYYKKAFNVKHFGVEDFAELAALIKDAIGVNATSSYVEAQLPEAEPLDKFLRFTEEHRRERQRCIDAGDETALLKFTRPAPPPPRHAVGGGGAPSGQYRGGGGGQRGSFGGGGQSRGPPPPHSSRSGPPRGSGGGYSGGGGGGGGGGGSRSSYGGPPPQSRGGGSAYSSAPVGAQKRTYTPPPPSPYPPSKHQRSGGGSYSTGASRGGYGSPSAGAHGSRGGGGYGGSSSGYGSRSYR